MRTLPALALMGILAQGCIIYEEKYVETEFTTDTAVVEPPQTTTDPGVTTPDPGTGTDPVVSPELFLTVTEGEAGDSLLTTLESSTGDLDLTTVTHVGFGRDIEVSDLIGRTDEVVLLVQIDGAAVAGIVDVYVESASGEAWILDVPFTISQAAGSTPTCGTPSDTGMADTGPATDTGCP